jgi:sulfoxide reductase heme-binding subunit YedZ
LTLGAARPEPAGGYAVGLLAGSGLLVVGLMLLAVVIGRAPSPVTWYVARASGIVLYLVLWLSCLLGLGLTTGLLDRGMGRSVIFSLHAFATRLAYGFLALHLVSLAADPTVRFGPRQLLLPFASTWREPWTGFGILAAALTIAIGVSFAIKRTIGQRAWRALHWLTFVLYALALLHGLGAGSDARTIWAEVLYLVTGVTVVLFCCYRLLRRDWRKRDRVIVPEPARDQLAPSLPA